MADRDPNDPGVSAIFVLAPRGSALLLHGAMLMSQIGAAMLNLLGARILFEVVLPVVLQLVGLAGFLSEFLGSADEGAAPASISGRLRAEFPSLKPTAEPSVFYLMMASFLAIKLAAWAILAVPVASLIMAFRRAAFRPTHLQRIQALLDVERGKAWRMQSGWAMWNVKLQLFLAGVFIFCGKSCWREEPLLVLLVLGHSLVFWLSYVRNLVGYLKLAGPQGAETVPPLEIRTARLRLRTRAWRRELRRMRRNRQQALGDVGDVADMAAGGVGDGGVIDGDVDVVRDDGAVNGPLGQRPEEAVQQPQGQPQRQLSQDKQQQHTDGHQLHHIPGNHNEDANIVVSDDEEEFKEPVAESTRHHKGLDQQYHGGPGGLISDCVPDDSASGHKNYLTATAAHTTAVAEDAVANPDHPIVQEQPRQAQMGLPLHLERRRQLDVLFGGEWPDHAAEDRELADHLHLGELRELIMAGRIGGGFVGDGEGVDEGGLGEHLAQDGFADPRDQLQHNGIDDFDDQEDDDIAAEGLSDSSSSSDEGDEALNAQDEGLVAPAEQDEDAKDHWALPLLQTLPPELRSAEQRRAERLVRAAAREGLGPALAATRRFRARQPLFEREQRVQPPGRRAAGGNAVGGNAVGGEEAVNGIRGVDGNGAGLAGAQPPDLGAQDALREELRRRQQIQVERILLLGDLLMQHQRQQQPNAPQHQNQRQPQQQQQQPNLQRQQQQQEVLDAAGFWFRNERDEWEFGRPGFLREQGLALLRAERERDRRQREARRRRRLAHGWLVGLLRGVFRGRDAQDEEEARAADNNARAGEGIGNAHAHQGDVRQHGEQALRLRGLNGQRHQQQQQQQQEQQRLRPEARLRELLERRRRRVEARLEWLEWPVVQPQTSLAHPGNGQAESSTETRLEHKEQQQQASRPAPKQSPRLRECAVCLEDFSDGDRLCRLPECGHVFHPDCVMDWLIGKNRCPTCCRALDEEAK